MFGFGLVWRRFREYLQINNFFQISGSVTFLPLQSPNFMQKAKKPLEPFLRKLRYQPTNQPNIKKSEFVLIWRRFCEYFQINNFFQKSGSVTFLPLQSPNFMQKIKKILKVVSEKTALPTKQLIPTTTIFQDLADAGPTM